MGQSCIWQHPAISNGSFCLFLVKKQSRMRGARHQQHNGQVAPHDLGQRTALRPLSDPDSESVVDPGDAEVMADPPGSELELGTELDPGPNPSTSAWPPAPELPPPSELPRRSDSAESVREP